MHRYILLAAFVASLLPAGALAGETAYEKHVARGIAAIEHQMFSDAAAEFRAALTERPDDETATLYLGTSLSRAGDPGAASIMKKALEMNPQDPRANLEMGIIYYSRSEYRAAGEYFERTMQLEPNSDLAEKAAAYLKAVKQGGGRPWSAGIQTGIQYDSNVIISGIDGLLPEGISRKSDWRMVLSLKARYALVREDKGEVWLAYGGYQSVHSRLHKFNVTQQQMEAGAGYSLSPVINVKTSYVYEYDLVGGDDFNTAHMISPSVTINEGKGLSTVLSYAYQKNHYMNSGLFSENHDRSGSGNSLGITQNLSVGDAIQVRAGYLHVVESARKDYWEYRGDQGMMDIRITLRKKVSVTLGGGYEKRDYKGIYPLTTDMRRDKTATASVAATKILSDRLSMTLGQLYVRNKSNVDVFDYKRAVSSLFLNVRF